MALPHPAFAAAAAALLLTASASCSTRVLDVVDTDHQPQPIHRYSFGMVGDTGTTVVDSIHHDDGTVVGTQLSGQGTVVLAGGTGADAQYVNLPHGLLRALSDVTVEAWVIWAGPLKSDKTQTHWQRIFDFGEGSTGAEGEQAPAGTTPQSYLFLTPQTDPRASGEVPAMRVSFQVPHDPQSVNLETVINTTPLPVGALTHVGVVVDSAHHQMSLFVNGAIVGSVHLTEDDPLSYVYDINDWLGRSQFAPDDGFLGTFTEFRIYAAPLTPEQMHTSFIAGPDLLR